MKFFFIIAAFFTSQSALADNLHLIDSSETSGFAIYRSGAPSKKDMADYCKHGIQEMMVLSGDAKDHEFKYQSECPTLRVIYDVKQDGNIPLDQKFLDYFDHWVQDAQATGKKIVFRCQCGCHRTGRLAAYYQMKYQNNTSEDAIAIMNTHGKFMLFHPELRPQVLALEDEIKGRPCTQKKKYCVNP
jgi:protein-tyrosine phosphatase